MTRDTSNLPVPLKKRVSLSDQIKEAVKQENEACAILALHSGDIVGAIIAKTIRDRMNDYGSTSHPLSLKRKMY